MFLIRIGPAWKRRPKPFHSKRRAVPSSGHDTADTGIQPEVAGPPCLPCGIDNVTLRRPLIVGDSTFEYRPTSWPGMLLNSQDKKIRYQLINYERPRRLRRLRAVLRALLRAVSQAVLRGRRLTRHRIQSSSTYPVTATWRVD
ncbi:hypothetical protein MSG28_010930 [Choristoneura fumiferana]|uniref:Uncharacterized protein n=1 Tax=Choristoneura fumiferana TaxID=7141 RepID=A0ACC0KQ29_CHOFU|nr:hypothetical protein MSG28_010930 [Choristoneura fumiferana]